MLVLVTLLPGNRRQLDPLAPSVKLRECNFN
jgi:hypothetical protein